MYKSKLQELCHKQSWSLPEYSHTKHGPDHHASFIASVTVNGTTFRSPDHSSSARLAQNDAAKIALLHFTEPQFSSTVPLMSPLEGSSVSSSSISGCSSVGANVDSLITINGPTTFEDPQIEFAMGFFDSIKSTGLSSVGNNADSGGTFQAPQVHTTTLCSIDDNGSKDVQHVYKSQLQIYAQKKNFTQLIYSSEREGPPHNSRFKSKLTVNGQTFESPGVFHTLKEAEHAAAKVALQSLSTDGVQEDDSGFYKNALQVLVQKEGFGLPIYSTNISGKCHMPTFVSTVNIKEEVFQGCEAKAKKQAEASAAKAAYITLTERKKCPARCQAPETHSSSFGTVNFEENSRNIVVEGQLKESRGKKCTEPKVECQVPGTHSSSLGTISFEENVRDIVVAEERPKNNRATDQKGKSTISSNAEVRPQYADSAAATKSGKTPTRTRDLSSSSGTTYAHGLITSSSSSSEPPHPADGLMDSKIQVEWSAETSNPQHKKVVVLPRSPNMTFPDGVDAENMLPISDDKWVALSSMPSQVGN